MVWSLRLSVDDVLVLVFLVVNCIHQLLFDGPELHTALIFSNLVSEADHHWSIVLVVLILVSMTLQFLRGPLTPVVLGSHDYLFDQFLVILDTIRHRALAQDRILSHHVLQRLLPKERFQLVLNVQKALADLLLLPKLLVLTRG